MEPPTSTALLHLVMVPYPLQGQINPMLNLAQALLARCPDLIITFVNNKHNHDRILQTLSTTSQTTNLNFTWVHNGLPPDFDYSDIALTELHLSTYNMKAPLKKLLETTKIPVTCVFFGTFCSQWAHAAATELGIPTFLFWTQSAVLFSLYYHVPLLSANGFFPTGDKCICEVDDKTTDSNTVSYVPGVAPLRRSSFPTFLQVKDTSDPALELLKEEFGMIGDCLGVIINSFEELEKDACRALQEELPSISIKFMGPVLPLAFLVGGGGTTHAPMGLLVQDKSECLTWLDSKPKISVLYISFGSLFNASKEDLEPIATGIKASNLPFLWVIKPKSSIANVSDILPPGFVEDTVGRGLIVPWAPQVQVLSHPAVGAFLTHCGWNSTLESLSMGVPMIGYPISLDQPTNCAYVSDVWKVGMELKRQYEEGNRKVESRDVERAVRAMLQGDEGEQIRRRAWALQEAAKRAVRAHGSSYMQIDSLIRDLTSRGY